MRSGLAPIVESCLVFDGVSVILDNVWQTFPDPNQDQTILYNCNEAGQAEINLNLAELTAKAKQSRAGLPAVGDITDALECVQSGEKGIFPILGSCRGDGEQPLRELIDHNLVLLQQEYADLAPCLNATGGSASCETKKIVNNAPAPDFTAADPIGMEDVGNLTQAMYPDLTQTGSQGGETRFCSVQQDPTAQAGFTIIVDPANPFDYTKWQLPPLADMLKNPLMSPMNQIDNGWTFNAVYQGRAGNPVALGDPAAPEYADNVPRMRSPEEGPTLQFTPEGNGILTQVNMNEDLYGWNTAQSMFNRSHSHGLCSPTRWEYNITDAVLALVSTKSFNGILHPNDAGQAQYAAMLGPIAKADAGAPVGAPVTNVVQLGFGKASHTTVQAVTKRVAPGHRAQIRIDVAATGSDVGPVLVRGSSDFSRFPSLRTSLRTGDDGSRVIKLPKSWTQLRGHRDRGTLKIVAQFLGNIQVKSSTSQVNKIHITEVQ